MPTYDYKCEECSAELNDIKQSFSDEPLSQCPECGKSTLYRVIYGGLATFVKDVKTVGQLADKNWSNMGSYKRSEIESSKKEETLKNQSPLSSLGSASKKQINAMSPEQKRKYIITGET